MNERAQTTRTNENANDASSSRSQFLFSHSSLIPHPSSLILNPSSFPPTACRLLIDPPASGAWNMAVDETLLESAAGERRFSFRLYRWQPATLSLGYFQAYSERER